MTVFQMARDVSLQIAFVLGGAGREHGLGMLQRARILKRVMKNCAMASSQSFWQDNLIYVSEILGLPRHVKGDVVECGCCNGVSTANLSMACKIAGRRLFACDSFEGLPPPVEGEEYAFQSDKTFYKWHGGDFASKGGIEGVKDVVRKHGSIETCTFVKGYFKDTLASIPASKIALVFEDADLPSSVEDCVRHLWGRMVEGAMFYSHEPWSTGVVGLFYDKKWWHDAFGTDPPGFFGSGNGIMSGISRTHVGYAEKFDKGAAIARGKARAYKW
jgi:hypothetical protein